MDYGFQDFEKKETKQKEEYIINKNNKVELAPTIIGNEKVKEEKKKINFQELPKDTDSILSNQQSERFEGEQIVYYDNNLNQTHLSMILSPNLTELEMMIRGLETVKRWNPKMQKEEVFMRKIKDHPLNDYGVHKILELIRVFISAEMKLGRRTPKDAIESAQQIGADAKRLIYKNLKNFGMDTQIKQRNAKIYCLAIFEFVYSALSRSIAGRENDSSRPTAFEVSGSTDLIGENITLSKSKKEQLKN